MTNHLSQETSPYLLQHARNPVDWYPWGPEALEKARREDKPVFVSIGYAACHWCHVMAHESFEDVQIAEILNRDFVSIKVDREERPDIDQIYMNAVVAMNHQGGWPLSVFITPDGKPFYGGTYFPPTPRYGMPSFRQVLESIAYTWKTERNQVLAVGKQLVDYLHKLSQVEGVGAAVQKEALEKAAGELTQSSDQENGGWGPAPKFPQPMAIEFMLRQSTRGNTQALERALYTLASMSRGGMYDIVGGGFHRYSTDERWLVPHFEKMLYDNALLARVYLYAYLMTSKPDLLEVVEETLDFVLREMTHPLGGFYSSLDADSEGEEGKFYVWTLQDLQSIIQDPRDFDIFRVAYGLTGNGNFEGRWVLQRAKSDTEIAGQFDLDSQEVREIINNIRMRLREKRSERVRPGTDDKILVSWNALMLRAFAEAARYLHRSDYLDAARKNAAFLLESLHPGDRLLRTWRNGQARVDAFLEDYGALIVGLLSLYEADLDPAWFSAAQRLAEEMISAYSDPQGGYFDTRQEQDLLIVRPKDIQDNATPSGNALAAHTLLLLSAYTDHPEWRDAAVTLLGAVQNHAIRYPTAFSYWLNDLDIAIGPLQQVAVMGNVHDEKTGKLVDVYNSAYRPRSILAVSAYPPPPGSPALLADRPLVKGLPTAYVCEDFACRLPVTDPQRLSDQLEQPQPGGMSSSPG